MEGFMNKEEKNELYKRYLESGLSIKEFALANDVSIYCMKGIVSYRKRFKEDDHDGFINVVKKDDDVKKENNKKVSFKIDHHLIEIEEKDLSLLLRCLS